MKNEIELKYRHAKLTLGFDLPGQGLRKDPFHEQACRFRLGRIETDLIAPAIERAESMRGQVQVTPGFEQAESDIFVRAEAVGEGLAKETAFLDQLEDEMSNLE